MAEASTHLNSSRDTADELLAPSMDESDPVNEAEAQHFQRLQEDLKAVRTAMTHDGMNTEEKKVEDPTDEFELDKDLAVNANSFEKALEEIEDEFEDEFGAPTERSNKESPDKETEIPHVTSSGISDGSGTVSTTFETSRYNNILGLLRNRREELAAALQKDPKTEDTGGSKAVTKVKSWDSTEDGETCADKANSTVKLEKIESSSQEVEEGRRRRQSQSPARSNATPPRSPQRSLPYFHKPSGTTPPASPSFLASKGNSPSQKASPRVSPRGQAEGTGASGAETASRELPQMPPLQTSETPVSPSRSQGHDAASPPGTPTSPSRANGVRSRLAGLHSKSSPSRQSDTPSDTTDMATARTPQRRTVSNRHGRQSPGRKPAAPDRIRFRDPYPILRPEKQPRDPKEIIAQNSVPREHEPIRWVRPKPDLKQLIVAAMGPSLARRSNACGALKVLTGNKKNQINLFRTDSFMSSIIFCASQDISERETDMALDARTRALTCLKNVCEPKINRYHIVTFPGLLDCLSKAIEMDDGESRALACGALALLAKTSECREEIVKDFKLVKLLALVLGNRAPAPPPPLKGEELRDSGSMSPHSQDMSDHTDEEDDESETETPVGEESTVGDYDTAFAGSLSLLESFDIMAGTKSFDRMGGGKSPATHSDGEYDEASDDGSYESETDQPAMDSIRKKNMERSQAFMRESRATACAVLLHLSRECGLSVSSHRISLVGSRYFVGLYSFSCLALFLPSQMALCNNRAVLTSMILVANETANPIHTRCLEFIFNLTRFPANNAMLTPHEGVVATLLSLGSSDIPEDRLLALQTLQNLSSDQSSKSKLAVDPVLGFLTACAVRKDESEREAAVSTLQNISTEPGAVVAITNTKNAIATLVHLAHSPSTKQNTRQLACETLANISLWLQTLAGTGKIPEGVDICPLPTLKTSGWTKWE